MKAHQLKTLAAFTSLAVAFSSVVQPVSALTVPEAITSIQSSNPTLPSGVANPKGNIGFLLANMFWNSSDIGYDSTKFGKIKPTYFDGAGATAWTYAGGNTYMTDMNGRVGIGTNDPQAYIHLKSNLNDNSPAMLLESPAAQYGSPRIALVDTSSGSVSARPAWMLDNSFDRFRIFRQPNLTTPGLAHFLIDGSGSVSVGSQVDVYDAKASFEVRRGDADSEYAAWIEGANANNLGLGVNIANSTSSKGIANFKSNNVSRLFVRADGNVGIGTTAPDSALDVNGDISGYTRFKYTSVNGDYFWLRSRIGTEPNALSIGIGSDETTGTTKDIRMLTNGIGRFFIGSDGKIGIGTTSPSATLDVNGQIRIAWGAPGAGKILTSDATGLATWTTPSTYAETDPTVATTATGYLARWNGSQLVNSTITDDGTNVGIGTSSPSQALEIKKTVAWGSVIAKVANISTTAGTQARFDLATQSPNSYGILAITENGGGITSMELSTGNGVSNGMYFTNGTSLSWWNGTWPFVWRHASTERMRIDTGGNVGIGTTNPAASLEVKRSVADSNYAAWIEGTNSWNFGLGVNIANTTTTKAIADFRSANVSRFHVRADGNVGIGTTTPNATLNVVWWANFSRDNASECCSSSDANISLAENTNSTGKMSTIQFHNSGVAEGYFRLAGSGARRFQMGDNQGITMGLQMSGNLQVDGTGNSYLAGNVGIGTSAPAYKLDVIWDVISTWYLRTRGTAWWYSETYGGGWYMSDSTWIRSNWGKSIWVDAWILGSQGWLTVWYGWASPNTSAGAIIAGHVGIGTNTPAYKLDVVGTANVTGFRMSTGAGAGKVLTSDASGLATWAAPATGGGITAITTASCVHNGGESYAHCTANCPAGYFRTGCALGWYWSSVYSLPANGCQFQWYSWTSYVLCAK